MLGNSPRDSRTGTHETSTENFDSQQAESLLSQSWSLGSLRPWLQVLARSRVSDPHEASDVVQQTLLQAWQNEGKTSFQSAEERLAWLRVVLTNTVRRRHRDRMTEKRGGCMLHVPLNDEASLSIAEQVAVKTHPVLRAEETLRLANAIDKLPEDQRYVIVRHQYEHASYATLAKELKRSEAAVRMLKVRALRSLARLLKDEQ